MGASRRTARQIVVALTFGVAGAAYYACAVYEPSLLLPGPLDAGGDVVPQVDAGSDADPCSHARPPARTGREDEGGAPPGELIFAVSAFDFNVDGGSKELIGYDIDNTCTCPGQPSCKASKPTCDDPRGRDNAAGILLDAFSSVSGAFKVDGVNARLAEGSLGLLFRVRNYNGTPNDPQIETAIFLSNGTAGSEDGGTATVPQQDGNDVWTVDPKSLLGGVAPPYIPNLDNVDSTAYVVDGKVVANITRASLAFAAAPGGASSLQVELSQVVVTGDLASDGKGGFTFSRGMLVGRWPTGRFLTAMATLRNPLGTDFLCGDSGVYASVKGMVCGARDVSSTLQSDNTNAPCDALSFALMFAASPAKLGSVYAAPPPVQPCGPQWTDECP